MRIRPLATEHKLSRHARVVARVVPGEALPAHVRGQIDDAREGRDGPVVVKQDNILAATFHPELAHEDGLHKLLLDSAR